MKIERRALHTIPQELEDRVIRFIASTDAVDRHGSRVIPKGMHLENYLKSPIFLWSHPEFSRPEVSDVIGKVVAAQVEEARLIVDVKFADHDKAEQAYQLVKGGFLNAVSIAFLPIRSHNEDDVVVHDEVELTEISLVLVGSNPEALALRHKRTLMDKAEACKQLGIKEDASPEECSRALREWVDGQSKSLRSALGLSEEADPESEDKNKDDAEAEKRGLLKAVTVLQTEVTALRGKLEVFEKRSSTTDVERWVDQQLADGRYPKDSRAALLEERRQNPKAAEKMVLAIPKGTFTRGAPISQGGAPTGTTPDQAGRTEEVKEASKKILAEVDRMTRQLSGTSIK